MTTTQTRPADRQLRAYQQSADYLVEPSLESEDAYTVINVRTGKSYTTTEHSCSCPDATFRKTTCRHQHLVRFRMQEEMERERPAESAYEKAWRTKSIWG